MIKKDIAISQYFRVAETIAGRIKAKEYEYGDSLPSEREFQDEFGVSRITIRKALDMLAQEGIIKKHSGKATEIIYKENPPVAIVVTGDFKNWSLSALGTKGLKIKVLEIKTIPSTPNIAEALVLNKNDPVWRMKRIKTIDGKAFSYHINYGVPKYFQNLNASDFLETSFVGVLQSIFDLERMEQRVAATIADIDVSRALGIEFGDPVFYVENIYVSERNAPIAFTHVYYRGDKYIYQATIPF